MPPITSTDTDIYGQSHPIETPQLIQQKLQEFDSACSDVHSQTLEEAQRRYPDGLNTTFKLMFLRSEVYCVPKAVKRYVKYWDKRVEIFGPDRAFRPLTLQSLSPDELQVLYLGAMHVFYCQGRCMAFVYPKKLDRSKYTIPNFLRAFWYIAHVALENEETVKKGIVVVGFSDNIKVKHLDVSLGRACVDAARGILPVRFSGYHITHPSRFAASLWHLARPILGDKFYSRFKIHCGSQEEVLHRLAAYGMGRSELPVPIGGELEIDVEKWVRQRSEYEASTSANLLFISRVSAAQSLYSGRFGA